MSMSMQNFVLKTHRFDSWGENIEHMLFVYLSASLFIHLKFSVCFQ